MRLNGRKLIGLYDNLTKLMRIKLLLNFNRKLFYNSYLSCKIFLKIFILQDFEQIIYINIFNSN